MKRLLSVILAVSILVSASVIAASAEESDKKLLDLFNGSGYDVSNVYEICRFDSFIVCHADNGIDYQKSGIDGMDTVPLFNTVIGDYEFRNMTPYKPDSLGLFVVDNGDVGGEIYSLQNDSRALSDKNMEALVSVLRDQYNYSIEKISDAKLRKLFAENGFEVSTVEELGESGDFKLYRAYSDVDYQYEREMPVIPTADYVVGDYEFRGFTRYLPDAFGMFVANGDKVYTLKYAYEGKIISDSEMDDFFAGNVGKYPIKKFPSTRRKLVEDYFKTAYPYYGASIEYLGEINGKNLIYGSVSEMTDSCYYTRLGDYIFSKFYVAQPYELALYVVDDERVYTIEEAYGSKIITDDNLPELARKVKRIGTTKMSDREKQVYDYLEKEGLLSHSRYTYRELGDISGYKLIKAQTNRFPFYYKDKDFSGYTISVIDDMFGFTWGLELFLVKDSEILSAEEALNNNVITIEELRKGVETSGEYEIRIEKTPESKPEEPIADNNARIKAYIRATEKLSERTTDNDIVLQTFDLGGNKQYFSYHISYYAYNDILFSEGIDKYRIDYGSDSVPFVFDGNTGEAYGLSDAFDKDIISSKQLGKLSGYLADMYENKAVLKAGESYPGILYAKGTSSNPKAAKIMSVGKDSLSSLQALTKGTAKITFNKGKEKKPAFMTVKVKNNPSLQKSGKTVSSVSVKKGKTVKVRITGKSAAVDNKYVSTRTAKITSKKNVKVISVKGLKKGKTVLKITVNGKVLKLNVNVK